MFDFGHSNPRTDAVLLSFQWRLTLESILRPGSGMEVDGLRDRRHPTVSRSVSGGRHSSASNGVCARVRGDPQYRNERLREGLRHAFPTTV